jgi:AcrR family transcriptional regulator
MTKEKILDTAERLIASQGFAGTSLRQIITEAGVNLAAVHYHFGSKEELLDQVIVRKVTAVNEERETRLRQLESEAARGPVPVERILAAFFEPMIETGCRNPQFIQLMGRMIGEGLIPSIVAKHFQPITLRFVEALQRALPELSEGELLWRVQFMFGAMSQAVSGAHILPPPLQSVRGADDFRLTMQRLLVFLSAGVRAPGYSGGAGTCG